METLETIKSSCFLPSKGRFPTENGVDPLETQTIILLRTAETALPVLHCEKDQPVPKKDHFLWLVDLGTA